MMWQFVGKDGVLLTMWLPLGCSGHSSGLQRADWTQKCDKTQPDVVDSLLGLLLDGLGPLPEVRNDVTMTVTLQ